MGKIYLLHAVDTEKYKVGITSGPIEKRVAQLQTGNPDKIILLRDYESDHYRYIESFLHRKFMSKRAEGEWFLLEDSDVFNFIDYCQEIEEIASFLSKNNEFF